MIRLITESEDFNRIIYNVNICARNPKGVCDFLLNEFSLLSEEKKIKDLSYYDDIFSIIYKSICKKNTTISYITLSYAIILIMISIKFSPLKICTTKDKGDSYTIHKNNLYIYPDCFLGIKIMNNDKYLLIDYEGDIKLNDNIDLVVSTKSKDFDYGKFLTSIDFKVFKFDQSKFQYVSNIHLEKYDLSTLQQSIKTILVPNAPYLIIAGNLTTYGCISRLDTFFDYYSLFYDKIIYILGECEYYDSNLGLDKTPSFYREYIRRYNWRKHFKKILFLDQELTIFNNIHIIGLTLWSNITNREMEDFIEYFKHIKNRDSPITHENVSDTHIKSVLWLNNTLKEIKPDLPVLIISYHIPSYNLVDKRLVELGNILLSEVSSNLDNVIRKYSNIINWIMGHEVALDNEILSGTLFLSNTYNKKSEKEDYIII